MTTRPQKCTVIIGQQIDGRWRILLSYEDGNEFMSNAIYATADEAKKAALEWSFENHVSDTPAS